MTHKRFIHFILGLFLIGLGGVLVYIGFTAKDRLPPLSIPAFLQPNKALSAQSIEENTKGEKVKILEQTPTLKVAQRISSSDEANKEISAADIGQEESTTMLVTEEDSSKKKLFVEEPVQLTQKMSEHTPSMEVKEESPPPAQKTLEELRSELTPIKNVLPTKEIIPKEVENIDQEVALIEEQIKKLERPISLVSIPTGNEEEEMPKIITPDQEGSLWIDEETSKWVITLGRMHGITEGAVLNIYKLDRKLGQVIVKETMNAISYVEAHKSSMLLSNGDYYRVVVQ